MKLSIRFLGLFLFSSLIMTSSAATARAGDLTYMPFTRVESDAAPDMYCQLDLGIDAGNLLQGVKYTCQGSRPYEGFYTVDQLRAGVVLFHYDPLNLDVVTASAPNLDPRTGGELSVRYVSNYLRGEFQTWTGSIEVMGTTWMGYTSPAEGHAPFNHLFAVKRTVLGQPVGIKELRATWVRW
jgi:hypothetical protein